MDFNYHSQRFSSQRQVIMGKRGAVATSQPLAAGAGLRMLQMGGNAFDAALATAAALTVVEPTSNGLGGDCFALFSHGGEIKGLNASGWLPRSYPRDLLQEKMDSEEKLGPYGWEGVTVPGQLAGWKYIKENLAELDWTELLGPAVEFARDGFPVSPVVAYHWERAVEKYAKNLEGEKRKHFYDCFTEQGEPPSAGEIWRNQDQAETLKKLAERGVEDFYQGEIADRILTYAERSGGYLAEEDLEEYYPEPVNPLQIDYRGHKIYELPPNGQGLIALQTLKIISAWRYHDFYDPEENHLTVEALKQSFADGKKYIGDPQKMKTSPERLLEDDYIEKRRGMIGEKALTPEPAEIDRSGTVYLAVADDRGNSISFIQSNFTGFGSGIIIPKTGIALHNRGHNFVPDSESSNQPVPGKKPYHTIIPGFYRSDDGRFEGPFGVMGGFMQPQGHVQVMHNMIDYEMNPQEALDAPRWRWQKNKKLLLEPGYSASFARSLSRRGHEVEISWQRGGFGRGQIVLADLEKKSIFGASEPRADGQVAIH